jgi:hypothetical protein
MKRVFQVITVGLLISLGASFSSAQTSATEKPQKTPRIEVCFVLDTTGSMRALIDGAKQKIWSIVNQMASTKPTPNIRMGLVGYRDRNDAYVTQVFDLTNDLDAVYGNLIGFQALGGGDQPESVNQALHEAVNKLSWSRDRESLKLIFLVGDAPPHMDYDDDVPYTVTVQRAISADITINTIQAGTIAQTTPVWQEIASKADGQFVRIDQTGNMRASVTPMDSDLARLSAELSSTAVPYGDAKQQAAVNAKNANANMNAFGGGGGGRGGGGAAANAPALADRLTVLGRDAAAGGARSVVTGDGELIRDISIGKIKLEDVKESELPPNMQKMTVEERKKYVDEQLAKRKELQSKVDDLTKQRADYLKEEMSKQAGTPDSFDARVNDMVRSQAQKKGIVYEAPAVK